MCTQTTVSESGLRPLESLAATVSPTLPTQHHPCSGCKTSGPGNLQSFSGCARLALQLQTVAWTLTLSRDGWKQLACAPEMLGHPCAAVYGLTSSYTLTPTLQATQGPRHPFTAVPGLGSSHSTFVTKNVKCMPTYQGYCHTLLPSGACFERRACLRMTWPLSSILQHDISCARTKCLRACSIL